MEGRAGLGTCPRRNEGMPRGEGMERVVFARKVQACLAAAFEGD